MPSVRDLQTVTGSFEVQTELSGEALAERIAQSLQRLGASDVLRTDAEVLFRNEWPNYLMHPYQPLKYVDSGRLWLRTCSGGLVVEFDFVCEKAFWVYVASGFLAFGSLSFFAWVAELSFFWPAAATPLFMFLALQRLYDLVWLNVSDRVGRLLKDDHAYW